MRACLLTPLLVGLACSSSDPLDFADPLDAVGAGALDSAAPPTADGTDGAGDGTDGTGGTDGTDGTTGADGTDGTSGTDGTDGTIGSSCDLSDAEQRLFDLITAYRRDNGLPDVPCSPSLSYVARTHSTDLETNEPHAPAECNMHSWSDAGPWTACCYTPDHAQAECMWRKPTELSEYTDYGFEISYGATGYNITPEGALEAWQGSAGHNAVILNEGSWASWPWGAMGVGIDGGFANVWFGSSTDPATQ